MIKKPRPLTVVYIAVFIAGLLLGSAVAGASSITSRKLGARTPTRFCEGIRFDGTRYEDFINSPEVRISDMHRCKWKLGVWKAQDNICGAATFSKPHCGR